MKAAIRAAEAQGDGSAVEAVLTLTNTSFETRIVTVMPVRSARAQFRVATPRVEVGAQSRVDVALLGQLVDAGKHAVRFDVEARDEDGRPDPVDTAALYLLATRDAAGGLRYEQSDYQRLFMQRTERLAGIGAVFSAKTGEPRGERVGVPADYLPLETLERGPETITAPTPGVRAGERHVTGRFRWRDIEGKTRPAYGWRAELYYQDGNTWKLLKDAYVYSDAAFHMDVALPAGKPLRVTFTTANRYFTPQDQDGGIYRWTSQVVNSNAATVDFGAYWVDLEAGEMMGLGELHLDAIDLWNRLVTYAKRDPLREKSMKLVFPNVDAADCGNCANTGGTVYITTDRAANHRTIYHELGHELMYEYWENQLPPGSGGDHSWNKCYTGGLALTEGFAHFVSWWARSNRDVANPSWPSSWNGENPDGACEDASTNELWVAATLWDLHDKPIDGDDKMWFLGMGQTFDVILGAGMKNDISLFRDDYRAAVPANFDPVVDAIFQQNHTFDAP